MGRSGTGGALCVKRATDLLQPATRDSQCALASSLSSYLVVNGVDMVLLWGCHLSLHHFWFTPMEFNNCTIWPIDRVEVETDRSVIRYPL